MHEIIARTDNVNCTSVKTASEAANYVTRFAALVNLSKFALASKPERQDAIQRIEYALVNHFAGNAERAVLKKVIELLMIE